MMTLWVHSWPWYPAEGCFSVEEVAAGSTPVTVAIINYDNKGLLSTCHHMITITNNAVIAQLARAPSWSLRGRWFDASQRHWNPHIRNTEKSWLIARSIALMDAYMDDGFSKSIHGNNADKLRWGILWVAGWCRFPIMVEWPSGDGSGL